LQFLLLHDLFFEQFVFFILFTYFISIICKLLFFWFFRGVNAILFI
jgi:hypothetical protein